MANVTFPFWVVRAWLQFLVLPLALRVFGFERVCNWACRPVAAVSCEEGKSTRLFQAVQAAGRFYYQYQRDCLPRALNTLLLLRSAGIPSDLCLGVRKFPFEGHAWVECEGKILDDIPSRVDRYVLLHRFSCRSIG